MTQEQTAEKMNISMSYLKKQGKLALKVFELENNVQNTQKILKKIVCAKTVKKKEMCYNKGGFGKSPFFL